MCHDKRRLGPLVVTSAVLVCAMWASRVTHARAELEDERHALEVRTFMLVSNLDQDHENLDGREGCKYICSPSDPCIDADLSKDAPNARCRWLTVKACA